jgi:hypothetical protein
MNQTLAADKSGKVDLRTPEDLSRYFRDKVVAEAEVQHAHDSANGQKRAALDTGRKLISFLIWLRRLMASSEQRLFRSVVASLSRSE